MKRAILGLTAAAVLAGSLSGCALPLAFTIASSVIGVIITAATDKGPTDHLVSAAMMKDCVLFRVLEGEEVCVDDTAEVVSNRPDGLYMKVQNPDGTTEVAKVTRVQPVMAYDEMPKGTSQADVIDAIRNAPSANEAQSGGMVDNTVNDLPAIP